MARSHGNDKIKLLNVDNTGLNPAISGYQDIVAGYNPCDGDLDNATTKYAGFTDKDGNWYIMKLTFDASGNFETARFIKGASDYTTNWTNRASLSYDYFYNIF